MVPELAVVAQGLRKCFGPICACEGLTLDVASGEIVGLVGPDGSGKTTTFRMLCGILPPDAGTATVAGYDVSSQPEAVKARIGYLPQRFSLHRDLTIDENIHYTAELYTVPREQWEQRREELLEMTYLKPFRRRLAGRLSGGMRQKLALVCTLVHRPEVLFLDEPTTGVDPVSRRDFWKLLYDLPRQGVTIVISTPYMDEAARCNRLVFMYAGQVLAADTPDSLRRQVPGQLMQVRCRPQREAREALKRCPAVRSVEVFGDRLHVLLHDSADPALCQQLLAEGGSGVPRAPPGRGLAGGCVYVAGGRARAAGDGDGGVMVGRWERKGCGPSTIFLGVENMKPRPWRGRMGGVWGPIRPVPWISMLPRGPDRVPPPGPQRRAPGGSPLFGPSTSVHWRQGVRVYSVMP